MRAHLGVLAATTALAGGARAADPPFPIAVANGVTGETDRYCGLYCVHQAGRLTGREVDLDRLIRPERLTGEFGSTAADLVSSCREFGIKCNYVPNTSYVDVCLLGGPVIVLVKNRPEARKPNHWIMVLQASPSSAEVYDPSTGVLRISAAELQSVWGGPAIVVCDDSDGPELEAAWAVVKVSLVAGVAALALLVLRSLTRTRLHPLAAVTFVSAGLAVAAQLADPARFISNSDVVRRMGAAKQPRSPAHVSPKELLGSPGRFLIVDARTPPQFQGAHITGAINLPITASHWRNRQSLEGVPADTPIVVYCNSASCPWAAALASSSLFERHTSVAVLDGGLEGYEAAGGTIEVRHLNSEGVR